MRLSPECLWSQGSQVKEVWGRTSTHVLLPFQASSLLL